MGIGPIASLATSLISSLFSGSNNSNTATTAATSAATTVKQDTSLISPFAQILGSLQQLQQSSPAQYSQVTSQIASNLQTAASTATANGNTAQAAQLTQLSKDFQTASTSGQLPNVEDLSKAVGHHHHHHGASAPATSATDPQTIIQTALATSGLTTS
jgi:hypothetical protein